jgi:hypothetical protein
MRKVWSAFACKRKLFLTQVDIYQIDAFSSARFASLFIRPIGCFFCGFVLRRS